MLLPRLVSTAEKIRRECAENGENAMINSAIWKALARVSSRERAALLYFVGRSRVITPASRAKEPLVSQLLHLEQAPKCGAL